MKFTELADTKGNVNEAILHIAMARHFAASSADGKVDIDKIIGYCDFAAQALKEASDCLQTEIDNILKEEGYK